MSHAVLCIATSEPQAITIVDRLKVAGFSREISVLMPDKKGAKDFAHEHHTKAPEGAAIGTSAGGAFGWLVGIGSLAIPGLGPFIAAGPIMAALAGAAVGATVGGVTGALVGLGLPEFEAKQYEGKLKKGNILISVHTENGDQVSTVKKIFKDAGAQDISSAPEAAVASR